MTNPDTLQGQLGTEVLVEPLVLGEERLGQLLLVPEAQLEVVVAGLADEGFPEAARGHQEALVGAVVGHHAPEDAQHVHVRRAVARLHLHDDARLAKAERQRARHDVHMAWGSPGIDSTRSRRHDASVEPEETQEPRSLQDAARELDGASPRDTNLAAAGALAQVIPGAGGFIAELISNIPRDRQRRQQEFLEELARQLDEVRDRLDEEFVRSEEFAALTEEVIEKANRRREMDKRTYYAALLANTVTPARPSADERWRMLDVLERLRPEHLRLLSVAATTTDGAPADMYTGGVDDVLRNVMPGVDLDAVHMAWGDLADLSILQAFPSGTMSRVGASNLAVRLTEFGRRFHAFIAPPE